MVFSPSRKAAVSYRVVGGVSLAAGDPLGDPRAWCGAIAAWLQEADAYGWVPGVLGASEQGGAVFRNAEGRPFTSDLSGQDFWTLLNAGYRPLGFVMGNCVYNVGQQNLGTGTGQPGQNMELQGPTQAF